jgi:hypothetical protein
VRSSPSPTVYEAGQGVQRRPASQIIIVTIVLQPQLCRRIIKVRAALQQQLHDEQAGASSLGGILLQG